MRPLPRLMLVTDRRRTRGRDLVEVVRQAVRGGVALVQLRERDLEDDACRALAGRLGGPGITLIVNGRPALARAVGALLHLPGDAPRPAGPAPFGRSVHAPEEAASARAEGASWIVAGTVHPTASKPGARTCGIEGLARTVAAAGPVPVFAIGGITAARVPDVLAAGAHGVAVCGAILEADDPAGSAREIRATLAQAIVDGRM